MPMTAVEPEDRRRIVAPPSMAVLATDALRGMIFSGELALGERLVETRLTERLGVSRPPLREALQTLAHEGLVVTHPRRGATVRTLTRHDVFEIVTLREELESFAVQLALPVRSEARLERCREALRVFEAAGRAGDETRFMQRKFDFHLEIVALAGHSRITETYRSLSFQMLLCFALNRAARRDVETLLDNVERHRELLEVIEAGDPEDARRALAEHGHGSFLLDVVDQLDGGTPESEEWLAARRALR
ncbi:MULTISPECIES: GntR family transcriptional regulator [unclassified Pseudonocardia]|uniref:GntR family transcriptional regulator n=1 Tax=unclassified Pseudonocardia TaxID=2619320 RepID=UPI0011153BC0|nr:MULTISPECIES: GntR family transcriptional regulator [unclassified Pseudonocardia]